MQSNFNKWESNNIIKANQRNIILVTEKICTDKNCKFRQLALRIFNHLLAGVDNDQKTELSARQLSKKLGVHYDTVTKCLKYLKHIDVLKAGNE